MVPRGELKKKNIERKKEKVTKRKRTRKEK